MKIGAKVKIVNHPELEGKEGVLFLELFDKVTVRVNETLHVVKPEQIKEIKEKKHQHRPVSKNFRRTLDRHLERVAGEKLSVERFVNRLFEKE